MSNDISSELTNYVKTRTSHVLSKSTGVQKMHNDENASRESYEAAQNYLNALGRTKVNMDKSGLDNRVISSLDILKKNPEFVECHMDFCDMLQEKGYSLEDAVIGADIVFDKLKEESTYRS
ncbi:MAG: hypothetical protein IJ877_08405 [Candidatus Gastranaerophilales bacterium]|nr:hypothetical protein [Candidatus Gastranaerophilales bacterium]